MLHHLLNGNSFVFFVWLTLNTPHPHQLNHLFWGLLITPSVVLGEDLARTPGVKMHLARETGESANQSVPGPLLHFISLLQGSYSSLCCAHITDCKSHVHSDFQIYILFTVLQFPIRKGCSLLNTLNANTLQFQP